MPRSALLSQAVPAAPGLYIPHVPVPSLIPLTPRGDSGPARSRSIPPPARRRQPGFIRHYLFLYTLIHTVPRVVSSSPSSVLCPCRVQSAVGGTHTLPRVPGPSPAVPCPLPIPVVSTWGGRGGRQSPSPRLGQGHAPSSCLSFPVASALVVAGAEVGALHAPWAWGGRPPRQHHAPTLPPCSVLGPGWTGPPTRGEVQGYWRDLWMLKPPRGSSITLTPARGLCWPSVLGPPAPAAPPRNLSGGGGQWGGGLYLTCSAAWEEQ